jgi:hypothetical protein
MKTRKGRIIDSVNLLAEQRYLEKKFKEDKVEKKPKFNVMPVDGEGPVKKWKISLFSEKPNGGLKDMMTDDILKKLDLKKTYVSKESALEDLEKVNISDLEL